METETAPVRASATIQTTVPHPGTERLLNTAVVAMSEWGKVHERWRLARASAA